MAIKVDLSDMTTYPPSGSGSTKCKECGSDNACIRYGPYEDTSRMLTYCFDCKYSYDSLREDK